MRMKVLCRRDIFISRFINEAIAFSGNENRRINYFLLILFNRKGAELDHAMPGSNTESME